MTELLITAPNTRATNALAPPRIPLLSERRFLRGCVRCDEPHEADYGPTITSALLYPKAPVNGEFRAVRSISPTAVSQDGQKASRRRLRGRKVRGRKSTAIASLLSHSPLLDWGTWGKTGAAGAFGPIATEKRHFGAGRRPGYLRV